MGGLRISGRGLAVPPSPIRKLVPLAEAARARGLHVHALNIGQPDLPTPDVMWRAVREGLPRTLAYSPSAGIPELRAAFAAYYAGRGIDLRADQILVTAGGSEAILFAIAAVCDCGDDLLVPEPLYANYVGFARLLGVEVRALTCSAEEGYHLPPQQEWERRIGPRTRAILLCNPGNPTGTVYTEDEIRSVVEFACARDLYLIVDEVYREFCYDGRRHRSLMIDPGLEDRVILVDSISKRFSACGARIGCLATRNAELFEICLRFAQARLSPPGLGQIAAVPALALPDDYYDAFVAEFQRRRDLVLRLLALAPGVCFQPPRGAFYVMARLPVRDAEEFVRWMLTDHASAGETVMVAPGDGFYATPGGGRQEVRIAYVLEEETLERAVRILIEGLERFPGRLPPV